MELSVQGKVFPLARLKLIDIEHLGRTGVLRIISNPKDSEPWDLTPALRELVATSIRRAGMKVTADELGELADGSEGEVFSTAAMEVLKLSGFISGDASPNAPSPEASTTT